MVQARQDEGAQRERRRMTLVVLAVLMGVTVLALLASPPAQSRTRLAISGVDANDPAPAAPTAWTVALYVAADNNLDEALKESDAPELRRLANDPRVNVIALIDMSDKGTRLMRFGGGKSQVLARYPEKNMGDPRTLVWFLRKIERLFPSDHLMVDLWNHGGAWRGVCSDDSSRGDLLTSPELRAAFVDSGVPIDVLSFDACLNADVSLVYDLSLTRMIHYMVASEQNVPGEGFAYDVALGPLLAAPERDPELLVNDIVEGYQRHFAGMPFLGLTTMAAIDVEKVRLMRADLKRFSNELVAALPVDGSRIYSDLRRSPWVSADTLVDLRSVATRLAADEWLTSDALRAAARAVADDTNEAVLRSLNGRDARKFTGLTVWLPVGFGWRHEGRDYLRQSAFATQTGWRNVLAALNAKKPLPKVMPAELGDRVAYNDVVFSDRLHGYAVGYGKSSGFDAAAGVMTYTDDGGVTWKASDQAEQSAWVQGLVRLKSGAIGAMGSSDFGSATMYQARDGKLVRPLNLPTDRLMFDFEASSAGDVLWVGGTDGTLLAGNEFGKNWQKLPAAPSGRLTALALADADHGWVASENVVTNVTTISSTSDRGASFSAQTTLPGRVIRCLQAVDGQNLWAVGGSRLGGGGVIMHSSDGGATWVSQTTDANLPSMADVFMRNALEGWAVGDRGVVMRTADGGQTWQAVSVPTKSDLGAITFSDARHGYLVGDDGVILTTYDGGANWKLPQVDDDIDVEPQWAPPVRK